MIVLSWHVYMWLLFTCKSQACAATCCRRAEEAAMNRKIAEREEAALMKEQQYATMDQEVKDTKKRLKKLWKKHEVRLFLQTCV
jgi:hypothetical protein